MLTFCEVGRKICIIWEFRIYSRDGSVFFSVIIGRLITGYKRAKELGHDPDMAWDMCLAKGADLRG